MNEYNHLVIQSFGHEWKNSLINIYDISESFYSSMGV